VTFVVTSDVVLTLVAALILLAIVPWVLYLHERKRVHALVTRRIPATALPINALDPEAPPVGLHDHVFTAEPIGLERGWRIHGCLAPGCDARDFRRGTA
jgi:hypothetical protein